MLKSFKLCFVQVTDIILDFRGYFLFLKLQTRQILRMFSIIQHVYIVRLALIM